MNQDLKNIEKSLVKSFLIGAFVFLIIFECIFAFGRHFLEKNNHEKKFIATTNTYIEWKPADKNFRPLFGVIITDFEGKIIKSLAPNLEDAQNLTEIFTEEILQTLSDKKISYYDNLMARKVNFRWLSYYFFDNAYDDMNLFRSLGLFLILDLILLFPVWFLSRLYIRRILQPVQENIDTMTHFVHDAGHELKTPLAIMSGNLQLMRDFDKKDYDLIDESLATIDSMNESIQWLLELADLKMPDLKQKSNIFELVDSEIKKAKNDKNIKIFNHISSDSTVLASEKHLSILLRNLIENSIKYNKENWKVDIYFEKNILKISDTGIGMNNEDLKRIFDRFYRINQNSSVQGSGIGLTLVDKVARLYGWQVEVQSEFDKGSTFIIKF